MFGSYAAAARAIAALLIVGIIAGGIWHVMNLKAELVTARGNVTKLEAAIKDQKSLIASLLKDIKDIQKANQELTEIANRLRGDSDALKKKFRQDATGQSRDFGILARERPGLIEDLVNRGTRNALRCLEIASGSPRTKQELDAKTSSEINRECPSIANPNYRPVQ